MRQLNKKQTDWLWASAYLFLIFAAIPFAPPFWEKIVGMWGVSGAYNLGAAVFFLFFAGLAGYCVFIKKARALYTYAGLIVIFTAGFTLYRSYEVQTFAEKAHFIEYGVLGPLVVRAMRHHCKGIFVYVAALVVCSVAGSVDEGIQWFVPSRCFDTADIVLNAIGSSLGVAVAIVMPHYGGITARETGQG